MPALRLCGRWMEELGFAIGQTLHVRVRDGELVVSLVKADRIGQPRIGGNP
ncbi:SymE family type I addiction module toxin [Xanthomonas translucens]|uniref:SymE family type I addiction module toxin n=1 Tax=Xanthomonas campestris pv. translucens TaxID=343 RepID=UPI001F268C0A|nr:SymE family type I addiction module toxin [Xanthomonas translucens]UJB15193.1 type I toxin-antitoxin system SymE family toxin [Xanthomonas translucens pv. undulosa]